MFVQRIDGEITGLFANAQPGLAEEWLEDDAPEVVAYNTPPLEPNWVGLYAALKSSPVYAKLFVASREPEANTNAALQNTMRVGTALTLIMSGISNKDLETLEFAIDTARLDLIAIDGDLTTDELQWINDQFQANDFALRLT